MVYKRYPRKLILGEYYIVSFNYCNKKMCQFIQPTKCGFNFLDMRTHKCILRNHLYRSKCENHSSNDWFWVNDIIKIEKIIK